MNPEDPHLRFFVGYFRKVWGASLGVGDAIADADYPPGDGEEEDEEENEGEVTDGATHEDTGDQNEESSLDGIPEIPKDRDH